MADRAADDHHAARPDAGHPPHLHLDPEVHLPGRAASVPDGDRKQPGPQHPAADHGPHRLRPALRGDAEDLAGPVWGPRGRGCPARLRRRVHPHVDLLPVLLRGPVRSGYIGVSQLTLTRI